MLERYPEPFLAIYVCDVSIPLLPSMQGGGDPGLCYPGNPG